MLPIWRSDFAYNSDGADTLTTYYDAYVKYPYFMYFSASIATEGSSSRLENRGRLILACLISTLIVINIQPKSNYLIGDIYTLRDILPVGSCKPSMGM